MFHAGGDLNDSPLSLLMTSPGPAPPTPTGYFSPTPPFSPSSNGANDFSLETTGSIPFSLGARLVGAGGKSSPMRSRNMKEYEEQLERLTKENFDLKLRIYFLEERLGHRKGAKGDLQQVNIELKVETEALKKQLCEKHELVRQAASLISSLESQCEQKLREARQQHQSDTQALRRTIHQLQKDGHHPEHAQSMPGDLTQLCGLAFSDTSMAADATALSIANSAMPSAEAAQSLHGVFSLPTDSLSAAQGDCDASLSALRSGRSRQAFELEEEVERLRRQVRDLRQALGKEEQNSQALKEDIDNLHKEIEDRDEKVVELEEEVSEKELKMDQLMQELETRHTEIRDRDSTIQTLHEDLNKFEPQMEIKVQEIRDKERIIEAKTDQLQQQNKILVEIQITLDEKQKQIAELEDALTAATQNAEQLQQDYDASLNNIKEITDEVSNRDRTVADLKKELRRKEKKVRDLLAELNEALDMLRKAKWEAETSSAGHDALKDMVDDENERLWAELEQNKKDLARLRSEKEHLVAQAEEATAALARRTEEQQREAPCEERARGEGASDAEVVSLKKQLEGRDAAMQKQEAMMQNTRLDLVRAETELQQRREQLAQEKWRCSGRGDDRLHELITAQLLATQQKAGGESTIEALKTLLEATRPRPEGPLDLTKSSGPIRSTSLDPPLGETDPPPPNPLNSRPARSNSFSLLENALYAQMGQKVCNTNQTFNTYVLSGDAAAPSEMAMPMQPDAAVAVVAQPSEVGEKDGEMDGHRDQEPLQRLLREVNSIRTETQALKKDRQILSQKVSALQTMTQGVSHNEPEVKQVMSNVADVKEDKVEVSTPQDAPALKGQVDALRQELEGARHRVTTEIVEMATRRHQEALRKYKEEVISLRKRLADSHNACDMLRTRLEELVDFLEQIIELEQRGLLDLSQMDGGRRASLRKSVADSRSLSLSLSHSLMIGAGESALGDDDDDFRRSLASFRLDATEGDISLPPTPDASVSNAIDDLSYDAIAVQFSAEVESKTQQLDAIAAKLGSLGDLLQTRETQLTERTAAVKALRREVTRLEEESLCKDELLREARSSPLGYEKELSPNITADSNKSLHLSSLQHKSPERALSSSTFTHRVPSILTDASSHGVESVRQTTTHPNAPPLGHRQCDVTSVYANDLSLKLLPMMRTDGVGQAASLDPPSGTAAAIASPSESEAWSEPDRNVSLARIGLDTSNLASISAHDRSLSRSRVTRSAPFTSESDAEVDAEEAKEGSAAGLGISSGKAKRRSDAAEAKRLSVRLRAVEQLNETLRAELLLYQKLNKQMNGSVGSQESPSKGEYVPLTESRVENWSEANLTAEQRRRTFAAPSSMLDEIRSLRTKLEEAISNNDLLRDQLEAALSGYLNEENRHLTKRIAALQQETKLNQEKITLADNTQEKFKNDIKERETKLYEMGGRLADYMKSNQKLENKINDLNQEVKISKETLRKTEDDLINIRAFREEEMTKMAEEASKVEELETTVATTKQQLTNLHQAEMEKQQKLDEQSEYINNLEEIKGDYESRLADQDTAISELCENITKLQQANCQSSVSDDIVARLKTALQKSETRLLQVMKERFALVGEKTKLQAQLASATTQARLLQTEMGDKSLSSSEVKKCLISQLQNEKLILQEEKQAAIKEIKFLQEEVAGLKANLDHALSRENVTSSRRASDLASVQVQLQELSEKHSTLRVSHDTLLIEKRCAAPKGKKGDRDEVFLQLDAERCLTKNLQMQIKNLQVKQFSHRKCEKNANADWTSASSPELLPSPITTSDASADKENRIPFDAMAAESPDLGIGSDGHLSSMERLSLAARNLHIQTKTRLCSEPSHGRLISELDEVRSDRDAVSSRLSHTNQRLSEVLAQLASANQKKESVERAINRQLSKTHDVLRRANGNLLLHARAHPAANSQKEKHSRPLSSERR